MLSDTTRSRKLILLGSPVTLSSDRVRARQDIAAYVAQALGCETFPVIGKLPAFGHKWNTEKALGHAGVQAASHHVWDAATGYALTPIRGGLLVVAEYDDPAFGSLLLRELPVLRRALHVRRDDHGHFYVVLAAPLPQCYVSLKIGHGQTAVEMASLRGTGAYVVGPKSRHPSGQYYLESHGTRPVPLTERDTQTLFRLFHIEQHTINGGPLSAQRGSYSRPVRGRVINPRVVEALVPHIEKWVDHRLTFSVKGTASLYNNPLRSDDEHRSSFFSLTTGCIHDMGTGQVMNTHQLCQRFGIYYNSLGGLFVWH